MNKPFRLAHVITHPVQYQSPLLRRLAKQPEIDLTVFFLSDISLKVYKDAGFDKEIKWDTNLLDGYRHQFIPSTSHDRDFSFFNPNIKVRYLIQALNTEKWDAVWVHGYANIGLMTALLWCNFKKIPVFFRGDSSLTSSFPKLFKNTFIRYLVRKSAALLWVSSDNKDYYKYYGAKESQLFFTPYAVDNAFFQNTLPPKKEHKDKTVILFASKFIKRKNAPLLLQAFAQLDQKLQKKAELWFIGDGEDKTILLQLIEEHKLTDNVKLLGFKNQSELPHYFAQCDLFVLPSEKEPYGLVINEVMNLAKPILTTNEVGAVRDLVEHDVNGWVVNANDLLALSTALAEAITYPERLSVMGQKSLEKINKWSYEEDVTGILEALHSVRDSANIN